MVQNLLHPSVKATVFQIIVILSKVVTEILDFL